MLKSNPLLLTLANASTAAGAEPSRSCVVTDREDIRTLWFEGAFGCSTRSTRFKPAFLNESRPNKFTSKKRRRELANTPSSRSGTRITSSPFPTSANSDDHTTIREESMQLNLMELYYLNQEAGVAPDHEATGSQQSFSLHTQLVERHRGEAIGFEQRYLAYQFFRYAGWIPKNGAQYGCDYVLYRKHPELCHSKYCVNLESPKNSNRVLDVLRLLRAAEQTRKKMVLCDENGTCIQFKRWVLKHEQADNNKQTETR